MRMGNEESSSNIGRFLLFCVVVLAVVTVGGGIGSDSNKMMNARELMQTNVQFSVQEMID